MFPKGSSQWDGGRQDAGHAVLVATLGVLAGKWAPWEGGITERSCIALALKMLGIRVMGVRFFTSSDY